MSLRLTYQNHKIDIHVHEDKIRNVQTDRHESRIFGCNQASMYFKIVGLGLESIYKSSLGGTAGRLQIASAFLLARNKRYGVVIFPVLL